MNSEIVAEMRKIYQDFEDLYKSTEHLKANKVRMYSMIAAIYILLENVSDTEIKNKFLNYCEHMKADLANYGTRKRIAGEMLCDKKKRAKELPKVNKKIAFLLSE